MLKKILIGLLVVLVVVTAGLFVWLRAAFAGDLVRQTVEAQLTKALGQPVSVGRVTTTILPRLTMRLGEVSIGSPGQFTVRDLEVGTDLRALLSRRIEHADVRLSGARVVLPLPAFAIAPPTSGVVEPPSRPAVEIVSVDRILLEQVEVVSRGRTLRADVDLVPQARGVLVRQVTIGAGEASVSVTGQIPNLAGPSGELFVKAVRLDVFEMLAFVADFSSGAGGAVTPAGPGSSTSAMPSGLDVTLNVAADHVILGGLILDGLEGRARMTPDAVTFEPAAFGMFGGRYSGRFVLTPDEAAVFRLRGTLTDVDVQKVMLFAGTPDAITGRLSGTIDLTGRGTSAGGAIATVEGTTRIDIVDGVVKGLGLLRSVVLATSMRQDSRAVADDPSAAERFSALGATFRVADGAARTTNLRFVSPDLLMTAAGVIRLDGTAVDLAGDTQLSDALSKQAGRDLVRYTQKDGRVTVPLSVTGAPSHLQVRVDMSDVTKRAIRNRVNEEATQAIERGLGGLLKR